MIGLTTTDAIEIRTGLKRHGTRSIVFIVVNIVRFLEGKTSRSPSLSKSRNGKEDTRNSTMLDPAEGKGKQRFQSGVRGVAGRFEFSE